MAIIWIEYYTIFCALNLHSKNIDPLRKVRNVACECSLNTRATGA